MKSLQYDFHHITNHTLEAIALFITELKVKHFVRLITHLYVVTRQAQDG